MSVPAQAAVPLPSPQPVLFLSHAGADSDAARKLADRIEATPEARAAGLKVWLDKTDLEPGRGWQQQLERAITEQSTAFAVYVGASGVVNWVDSEVRLALSRARRDEAYRFIPIISAKSSGSSALPPFAGQYHAVRNVETDEAEFAKLIRVVLNREPRTPIRLVDRPFPGLVPFDESKNHLFFGRDMEAEDLVERLRRHPLLMVVGGSGSGKSSLVCAGLVPRFRGGALADRSGDRPDESVWHVVITRPRGQPFAVLADALADAGREVAIDAATLGTVKDWVRTGRPEKVRDALLHGAPPKAKILLVVDQFEELLTQTKEPLRQPFVDALLNLVADPADTTVRVVLTMRQDYYNLSSAYPALYARFEADNRAAKYPIPRMKEEGLRACVREPLKLAGIEDSRVLEDEVVKDVGEDRASQLALVQMALSEAWRYRNDKEFGGDLLKAYVGRGRVAGALAKAADEVYEKKLKGSERALAEAIFIRLVQLGDTGGTTRRIASRDEFSGEAWELAQKLADEDHRRLLVIPEGAETAELSHEALVTQWPQYQRWLQNSQDDPRADDKRTLDRLIERAARWRASGEKDDGLATGAERQEFQAVARSRPHWLSASDRRFLDASVAAHRAELEAQRQARERERRLTWALGIATAVLVIIAAAATFLGTIASVQWGRAAAERDRALINQSRFLAKLSRDQINSGQPSLGSLLALEALPRNLRSPDRPYVLEAETALYQAVSGLHERLMISAHEQPAYTAAFDREGRRVVTASQDGTARLWDGEDGRLLLTLDHGQPVSSAAFDPAGRRVVTGAGDGTVQVWDAETGRNLLTLQQDGWIFSVAFDSDGRRVITASEDDTARLWDAMSGRLLLTLGGNEHPVRSAAFSPDGVRVITGSRDGTARLWDAMSGRLLLTLRGHGQVIYSVAFDSDGRRVVTASEDGTVRLWDADMAALLSVVVEHKAAINSAEFDGAGRRLVTGAMDGTARVWDVATGQLLYTLDHQQPVRSAAFDRQGRRVVTASQDGTARLWDVGTREQFAVLRGHDGPVLSAAFSPNGRRVLTRSADGIARVWDAEDGQLLHTLDHQEQLRLVDGDGRLLHSQEWQHPVFSAAFDPTGQWVATGSADGTATVWNVEDGEILRTLRPPEGQRTPVYSVAFSRDSTRVVTGSEAGTVQLWDDDLGSLPLTLKGHNRAVLSVAFAMDGRRVVTASADGTARLWDAESGRLLHVLEHERSVRAAAFDPEGRRVVTASEDGTARLWDAEDGEVLLILDGHTKAVVSAAFDRKGRRVVTASQDGTARISDLSYLGQDLINHACNLLPRISTAEGRVHLRRLTSEERERFFLEPEPLNGNEPVCLGQ